MHVAREPRLAHHCDRLMSPPIILTRIYQILNTTSVTFWMFSVFVTLNRRNSDLPIVAEFLTIGRFIKYGKFYSSFIPVTSDHQILNESPLRKTTRPLENLILPKVSPTISQLEPSNFGNWALSYSISEYRQLREVKVWDRKTPKWKLLARGWEIYFHLPNRILNFWSRQRIFDICIFVGCEVISKKTS